MIRFEDNPWIISDTHFNHLKIQEYSNRPDDWQDTLIFNWIYNVKDNDIILHLGDFALGKRDKMIEIASLLTGKIYLLKGNHDRQKKKFYDDLGITLLEEKEIIWNKYIFTHRPRIVYNQINIHGHIHNLDYEEPNHINVCVEKLDYKPIKLFDIIGQVR